MSESIEATLKKLGECDKYHIGSDFNGHDGPQPAVCDLCGEEREQTFPGYCRITIDNNDEMVLICNLCRIKLEGIEKSKKHKAAFSKLEAKELVRIRSCLGRKCCNFDQASGSEKKEGAYHGWPKVSGEILRPAYCRWSGEMLRLKSKEDNNYREDVWYVDDSCNSPLEPGDIELDAKGNAVNEVVCPSNKEQCPGLKCPKISYKPIIKTKTTSSKEWVATPFGRGPVYYSGTKTYRDGEDPAIGICGL